MRSHPVWPSKLEQVMIKSKVLLLWEIWNKDYSTLPARICCEQHELLISNMCEGPSENPLCWYTRLKTNSPSTPMWLCLVLKIWKPGNHEPSFPGVKLPAMYLAMKSSRYVQVVQIYSDILFWQDVGKLTKSILTTWTTQNQFLCCPAYRITFKIGPRSLETEKSLSLFSSSSTSSSSSLIRRWRIALVFPLTLPARLPPRLALAAKRRADLAGVGRLTSVGVKNTPSCCQVKEANLLFITDSAILINWKKMF